MSNTTHIIRYKSDYISLMLRDNNKSTPLYSTNSFYTILGNYIEGSSNTDKNLLVTNGVITYVGEYTKDFELTASFDMVCSGIGKKLKFQFFRNGIGVNVPVERYVSTGIDIGAAALCSTIQLKSKDIIEFKAACTNSTTDLIVKNLFLNMREIR